MASNHGASAWAKISNLQRGIAAGSVDVQPLILVAHADDETIAASVVLGRMRDPIIVFLTDGAPRDRKFWSPDANGSREQYARLRRDEAISALNHAGVPPQRIFWLGAVDQEAIEHIPELMSALVLILRQTQPDVIITHPYEGGHPDHDSAALISRLAASAALLNRPLEILEFASYHLGDSRCVTGEFLPGIGDSGIELGLSPQERSRKEAMIASHRSQRLVLEGFSLEPERLRRAPDYDFSRPPHPGKLWYECLGWPMTEERWRQLATAALVELQHT